MLSLNCAVQRKYPIQPVEMGKTGEGLVIMNIHVQGADNLVDQAPIPAVLQAIKLECGKVISSCCLLCTHSANHECLSDGVPFTLEGEIRPAIRRKA